MAKPARSLMVLDELAGWLTFGEAAAMMDVTVERVRQLATNPGDNSLTTAKRIGKRPLGIVREAEVREWVARKKAGREVRNVAAGEDQAFVDAVSAWPGEVRDAS